MAPLPGTMLNSVDRYGVKEVDGLCAMRYRFLSPLDVMANLPPPEGDAMSIVGGTICNFAASAPKSRSYGLPSVDLLLLQRSREFRHFFSASATRSDLAIPMQRLRTRRGLDPRTFGRT